MRNGFSLLRKVREKNEIHIIRISSKLHRVDGLLPLGIIPPDPSRPPFVLGEKGRRFLRLDAVGPPLDFGGIAIVKIEEPWRRSEKAEGKQRGSDYACENGILSHWINQRAFGDKAWDRDTLLKGYSLPATSPFRLSR